MSKEYVWELEVEDVLKNWKCVVHETECVTYEDDVEVSHIPITNPKSKKGILQIDTVTNVFGDELPFQLERGIPYIKIDDQWVFSDTTREESLQKALKNYRLQIIVELGGGLLLLIAAILPGVRNLFPDSLFMLVVLGIFFLVSGGGLWIRLRNELEAMGRKFTWK